MTAHRIADEGARQVLVERFPAMDGAHVYLLTAVHACPLVPVYRAGLVPVH